MLVLRLSGGGSERFSAAGAIGARLPGDRNGSMCRRIVLRAAAVCLVGLAAWPAWAKVRIAQVQVGFVEAGRGNYGRFGHWLPLRITVEADAGETLQAQVWVVTPDADGILAEVQAESAIQLSPERARQSVWAYVPCGHGKLRIEVREDTGRRLASYTYPDEAGGGEVWQVLPAGVMQVVAIGEPAGLQERGASTLFGQDGMDGVGSNRRTSAESESVRDPGYRVIHVRRVEDLPERWFGYDSVQVLVLATGGEKGRWWLEEFRRRPQIYRAIRQWVQQGGHLVVSAAENASLLASSEQFPLVDLLPGELIGGRRVYEEVLVGVRDVTMYRYREATSLPALRCAFADFRKRPGAFQRAFGPERDKPAVLVWPYGLGQVTLVAFDTNLPPFDRWDGRTAFWEWLLETEPLAARPSYRTALTSTVEEDALTRLVHQLEQARTPEAPFALVAALMLAYLLLAGPLDYLLIVRWLRRPALAWLTFPLVVASVTALAWYSANAIHGESLQVYQLDVYDLELVPTSGLGVIGPISHSSRKCWAIARGSGSTWLVIKSPRLAAFSIALNASAEPGHDSSLPTDSPRFSAADTAALPQFPEQNVVCQEAVLSWAIRPDDDALRRGSRENLVQAPIRLQPGQGAMANIPLQTWSLKALFGRWLMQWQQPPVIAELDLHAPDLNTLRGRLTWRAPWPLYQAELVYGNRVWPIGLLTPGRTVVLRRNDFGLLDRHRQIRGMGDGTARPGASGQDNSDNFSRSASGQAQDVPPSSPTGERVLDASAVQLLDSLRQLTFQRLLLVGPNQQPSPYLPFLDQSRRLRYGQAVLLGMIPPAEVPLEQSQQLPGLVASLRRVEPNLRGTLRRSVFVRIYLYPPTGE